YCNLGGLNTEMGQPEQALPWLGKAIATLEDALARDTKSVRARQFLLNSLMARGQALDRLRRYPEAVRDWDRALALDTRARQAYYRLDRPATLARAGKHGEGVAEADAVASGKNARVPLVYGAACVYALASPVAGDDSLRERYAVRAVELLDR